MALLRLRRFADLVPTPWKNGGGVTREVAAHPDGASMADFGWRISIATVASDGPFSVFPEIDRTLTVLDGEGLRLVVDAIPTELTPRSPPHPFPADAPASADLIGGTVTDLNVMTRRGAFRHEVARVSGPAELRAEPDEILWLVALEDDLRLRCRDEEHVLGRRDAARIEGARIDIGRALAIRIKAV